MFELYVAIATVLTPLIGSFLTMYSSNKNMINVKSISLLTTLFTLLLTIYELLLFNTSSNNVQSFQGDCFNITKHWLLVDGFGTTFAAVISLVCFVCVLWTVRGETSKDKVIFSSILLFEAPAIGAFYAKDMFLLFMLIETSIIPIYVIMSNYSKGSFNAILQLFLYGVASALLILTALIMIYIETGTSNLCEIYKLGIKNFTAFWPLITGICIKIPIWPFYHWVPVVHVESPTVCSSLLASIVLKFSSLLVVRFIIPLFEGILSCHGNIIAYITLTSAIFATLQLMRQNDLKRMFSYYSIVHMNLSLVILLGKIECRYFTFSVIQHSFSIALLFFTASLTNKHFSTRLISELKLSSMNFHTIKKTLLLSFLALIGIPGSSGFIEEIISIYAGAKISQICAIMIGIIILLSSSFAFYIYIVCFGYYKTTDYVTKYSCIDQYKRFAFFVLFTIILILGVFPNLVSTYCGQ
ncbi:MAG: hypothetical protein LBB34_00615 [Holosporales bacterium]|jgi:NADH-quinone oxidoreductase subunit M|nr:hypothetical protein [Holosporales bacterium]